MKGLFHTEDLNSYGFWIKTDGIDFNRYLKNNVLLSQHDYEKVIGVVTGLEVVDGRISGNVDWDDEDDDAKKIKRKYEKGFQKAFSIGVEILETSTDPLLIKPNQTRATVTKCNLIEISAVTIPSNQNAVVFYKEGKVVNLSAVGEIENLLPEIKENLNNIICKIIKY
jgi:HK97 family phage prohead protease